MKGKVFECIKKNKYIFIILVIFIIVGGIVGFYERYLFYNGIKSDSKVHKEEKNKVKLVVDAENRDKLPIKFRTTKDEINNEKASGINLKGMSDLNISGSGALSEKGINKIKEKIGNMNILDVDLRQESHGYINGIGVSWVGKNNHANVGLTRDKIISDEKEKLNTIIENRYVAFDKNPKNTDAVKEIKNPDTVQTEEELVKSLGIDYLRITVADHEKPSDDQVDLFIESIKDISKDTWVHFHCRGGSGRTTTFMTMYDMMHNAKDVSFDDILERENLIGGIDLKKDDGKEESRSRLEFLKLFYNYCRENKDDFKVSWSEWKKSYK